jgi:ATP-dependent DNA helicase UvrD/PcrA
MVPGPPARSTLEHMFDSLNPQQQAAVDHRGSPLLIVAGAGTGKTKTLAARVCRIIHDGADPSRVLLLTFTRRAAAEMLARVGAVSTDRAAARVWGGTFHSTANRLLRNFGQSARLSPGFTLLDQSDATDLMGIVRTDQGFGERGRRFPRKETVAGIYSRMVSSQAKLGDVLETDYPWCADHGDDLRTIFTAYTARKRSHQVLDYDDLLLFWRGLTVSPVGDAMRDLFDHILIDEYQDTNPIQADIVRGMCRTDTDLCAVGDDAQAIYGFRAATVANMWEFTEHFPGATRVTLEQNYRSTAPILAVANAVLRQSDEHFAKDLWSDRGQGLTPVLRTHHDEGAQSSSVATAVLDARERGIDLRQQAVLFRAGHHADGLELELTRRDIPFVKYGGLKYLDAAHVKDLLALLRILDNPADQLAWHRILESMEGIGPATVRRLCDELGIDNEEHDSLARFIDGAGKVPSAAHDQAAELRACFEACLAEMSPAEQVDRLKAFCALVFPTRYDNAAARLADIDQLAATASAYTTRSRFLTELTLDPPSRTSDRAGPPHLDDDWLTLSTIHSAKGLEWRSVHLLHAADGNLPSEMALGDQHGLAEELRLMYVALTRAKDELTVNFPLRFHVNRHAIDDRHVYAQLSRFIDPVRELFHEESEVRETDRLPDIGLAAVGVADEVDTLLASLWD